MTSVKKRALEAKKAEARERRVRDAVAAEKARAEKFRADKRAEVLAQRARSAQRNVDENGFIRGGLDLGADSKLGV